jgi:hypothetical protein
MNEGYDVSRQPPQLLQASPPFDQSQGGPRERRLAQPLPGMQAAAGPKREKRGMRLAAGSTNAPPSACLAHIAHLCCWLLLAAAGCSFSGDLYRSPGTANKTRLPLARRVSMPLVPAPNHAATGVARPLDHTDPTPSPLDVATKRPPR